VLEVKKEMALKVEDLETTAPVADSTAQEQPPRSLNSKVKVDGIKFTNAATVAIKMFWLDWKGNPVSYGVVQPGGQMRMNTFVTHPWKATGINGEAMEINGSEIWHPAVADANTEIFVSAAGGANTTTAQPEEKCIGEKCSDYRGFQNRTESGRTCADWTSSIAMKTKYNP
jgi:hypothetical protein